MNRFFIAGLLGLACCAAAYGTLRLTLGPRRLGAAIHVKWSPGVTDTERQQLERRYGLAAGELLEAQTWAYLLTSTSPPNVRSLVRDPAVTNRNI